MNVIEVNKLTKYYGKSRGIVDVSFGVEEGEIFGFIGPNGAGKSTTIRLLLSLIHPTSGDARVFGKDIAKEGPTIREQIGYLPSEVFYYDDMKVIDLLKYSASFYPCDCEERTRELASLMELELNRRIRDLSYGNRKKVGIVQGLLHSPKLLFLDEPTTGLDPLMQRKFFDLIRRENLSKAFGGEEPKASAGVPDPVFVWRDFAERTTTGVIGDARRASPQKGEKLLRACAAALAEALCDPRTWTKQAPR